ncbi:unnamed protein product [marine sediment metagenome]|uniref:Uncharacterized protein n=1 Tax=marine sediment metagenome TaxID=412755 RepID=X1TV20_9ZZZZ
MQTFRIGIGVGKVAKAEYTLPTGISGLFGALCDPCAYIAVATDGGAETQQVLTVETSYEDADIDANEIALSADGTKIKLGDDLSVSGVGGVVLTISGRTSIEISPYPAP